MKRIRLLFLEREELSFLFELLENKIKETHEKLDNKDTFYNTDFRKANKELQMADDILKQLNS